MILHSLEELECLLPDDMREKARKERKKREAKRASIMLGTKYRVLSLLPQWMRDKVTEAKILYYPTNTWSRLTVYGHTITLQLDKQHDVTFAVLDHWWYKNGSMKAVIKNVVEVYKKLQVLYRNYGHSLAIESLYTDDFGMYLPSSFYKDGKTIDKETESDESLQASSKKLTVFDFIKQLARPRYSSLEWVADEFKKYAATLDEDEKILAEAKFKYQLKKRVDYEKDVCAILENSSNRYYTNLMWNCVDIYMGKGPVWGREFCVKWNMGENLEHLKKLDTLRPLIDEIMKITDFDYTSFGVKRRNTVVEQCDPVVVRARMQKSA